MTVSPFAPEVWHFKKNVEVHVSILWLAQYAMY